MIGLDREFELGTRQLDPKDEFIEALARSKSASFAKVLGHLSLAELRHICRTHDLAVSGTKSALVARILDQEPSATKQQDLLPIVGSDENGDDLTSDLAAFFARAQPAIRGIVPLLGQIELAAVLRRLDERHGVRIDLSKVTPGIDGLAGAIEDTCELGVFLSELSREQLAKVCQRYALESPGKSQEDYVRTILAAAAGLTEEEARQIERQPEVTQTPAPAEAPSPAPVRARPSTPLSTGAEGYRASLAAMPRGVLHRVEAPLDPGELPAPGDLVRARQRQYLVSEVVRPSERRRPSGQTQSTLVKLACLDDDAQGRELEVFWELELGAERIDPARRGLGRIDLLFTQNAHQAATQARRTHRAKA